MIEKDPVDHLLLSLYLNYGWGNPYENIEDPDEVKAMKTMEEGLEMIELTYHARPFIDSIDNDCHFTISEYWPENIMDLLGEYAVKYFNKEGKIFLYEKCINEVGQKYYDDIGHKFGRGRQYYINIVREIVLWHELGHWITHWMPGKNGHRWNTRSYDYNYSTKDVHEGLAQVFTMYAILYIEDLHERNDYQQVFYYLLYNQAPCYHKHYNIIKHHNFSWQGFLNGIQMLRIIDEPKDVNFEYLLNNMK